MASRDEVTDESTTHISFKMTFSEFCVELSEIVTNNLTTHGSSVVKFELPSGKKVECQLLNTGYVEWEEEK